MKLSRANGFVPVNIPITFAMLCTAPTIFNIAFWQWINGTYNAGMNYFNRNTTAATSDKDTFIAYLYATGAAVGMSLSMRFLTNKMLGGRQGAAVHFARCFTMYMGAATANFVNVHMMRQAEKERGITVTDEFGEEMGVSKLAAQSAVMQTASSRYILSMPTFSIPAIGTGLLSGVGLMPQAGILKTIIDVTLCGVGLGIACPMGSSLFLQKTSLPSEKLEEEFKEKINSRGDKVTTFYFNKGL